MSPIRPTITDETATITKSPNHHFHKSKRQKSPIAAVNRDITILREPDKILYSIMVTRRSPVTPSRTMIAIHLSLGQALLSDDSLLPITRMFDKDGEPTTDTAKAISVVAGPDDHGSYWSARVSDFIRNPAQ